MAPLARATRRLDSLTKRFWKLVHKRPRDGTETLEKHSGQSATKRKDCCLSTPSAGRRVRELAQLNAYLCLTIQTGTVVPLSEWHSCFRPRIAPRLSNMLPVPSANRKSNDRW